MIIIIHSSKTMRPLGEVIDPCDTPDFITEANVLVGYLRELTREQVRQMMSVGPQLAEKTVRLIANWTDQPVRLRPAIESFLGDIYSGLQVATWTADDRQYAQQHLLIMSGLYGLLRPDDGIAPYRLEMGYKIPGMSENNLYKFWGKKLADSLPSSEIIVNLTAVEYGKAIKTYLDSSRVVTPQFLTVSPKTGLPTFVTVHTKIARGALAGWCIKNQVDDPERLIEFCELGYSYDATRSTQNRPVFICKKFQGLGLSVRLL